MFFPTNSNWSGTLDLILHEGFSWKNLLRHFLFLFTKTVDKKALSQISPNTGISPKTFWLLVWAYFPHCCKVTKPNLCRNCKLLNLNQNHPSKNVFLAKSLKIEILITSVMKMLELTTFGHLTRHVTRAGEGGRSPLPFFKNRKKLP